MPARIRILFLFHTIFNAFIIAYCGGIVKGVRENAPYPTHCQTAGYACVKYICRDRLCRVHRFCIKTYPVGNVPPERFQNQGTASGTQGGAVLFAPPSKSCFPIFVSGKRIGHGTPRPYKFAPRQLRSAGAAFSGTVFQNLFASARCFLMFAFLDFAVRFCRDTACRVRQVRIFQPSNKNARPISQTCT